MQTSEIKRECCGPEGTLDFEKMKNYMECCGKSSFEKDEVGQMKEFCAGEGEADFEKVGAFMEACGCKGDKNA